MTPTPPKINLVYREYVDALLRHQKFLSSEATEGDEAQQVEDILDALWDQLDEAQQRSVRGVSSDLNWIRRRGEPPPRGRADSEVSEAELGELKAAQDAEDWHAILHYLRVCAPKLPPDVLASSRAICYYRLEFPLIALAALDLLVELGRFESLVARFSWTPKLVESLQT